ncbi:MAG TPA: hypothetical protein VJH03_00150 [Blastocatellia bacterium]|nr:hypothetical protein [Blastocatellia bacterium]
MDSSGKKTLHGIELQTGAVMGELFEAIGFDIEDGTSYSLVADYTANNGDRSQVDHEDCSLVGRCWRVGNGLEIWSTIYDGGGEFYTADCRPAFRGRYVSALQPWELVEYDEEGEAVLRGSLHSGAEVVLELQNLTEVNPRVFREPRLNIGLAGLAYSDTLEITGPSGFREGRFDLAERSRSTPNETCENDYDVTGRVLAWSAITNPVTSVPLVWMYIDASVLQLEVLANRRALRNRVRIGSVLSASVWLQGHVLSEMDVIARYEGVDQEFETGDYWAGLRRGN